MSGRTTTEGEGAAYRRYADGSYFEAAAPESIYSFATDGERFYYARGVPVTDSRLLGASEVVEASPIDFQPSRRSMRRPPRG